MAEMGGGSEDTEAGAAVAELPKTVHAHAFEKLAPAVVGTVYPRPLGQLSTPVSVRKWFAVGAQAPLVSSDEVRKAVRDALREGGFKPTGRNKPASEYLVRAVSEGKLGSINLVVDACNVASLHSGVPISIVDTDLATPPLRIGIAPEGTRYVFNASGQEIDASGLLCLSDVEGPCANAVKDAQRTKTHPGTTRALVVVWGSVAHEGRAAETAAWYRALLERAGVQTADVAMA